MFKIKQEWKVMRPSLDEINKHPRDPFIRRDHEHRYWMTAIAAPPFPPEPIVLECISVTRAVKSAFTEFDPAAAVSKIFKSPKFKEGHKYWGMTADEIIASWEKKRNDAASAGTVLHDRIEKSLDPRTGGAVDQTADPGDLEWLYYRNFRADYPYLQPYRTEWMIYNEECRVAGTLDVVFQDPHDPNGLVLADWKRAAEIKKEPHPRFKTFSIHWALCCLPDTNFWHYALQLNIYKYILETKYGKRVTKMFLVQLHPGSESDRGYVIHEVPDLTAEVRSFLMASLLQ